MLESKLLTLYSLVWLTSVLVAVTSDHSGEWSEWSECSKSCDGGERRRNRTCELCNVTVQTQDCNNKACHDVEAQIIMISIATIAVISIMATVLIVIFFVKGNKTRKARASSLDTSKRLRTFTLDRAERLGNAPAGICVENRVFQLRNLMSDSKGSLQTSHSTLREFQEPTTPKSSRLNINRVT